MRIRLLPCASAELIDATEVLGLAMKKLRIGSEVPASEPLAYEGPTESWRTAGTNTR